MFGVVGEDTRFVRFGSSCLTGVILPLNDGLRAVGGGIIDIGDVSCEVGSKDGTDSGICNVEDVGGASFEVKTGDGAGGGIRDEDIIGGDCELGSVNVPDSGVEDVGDTSCEVESSDGAVNGGICGIEDVRGGGGIRDEDVGDAIRDVESRDGVVDG